jgi:2-polyprenyl-3-methyl-5-hydroxy-6-metoxy-1,4-benzoquinol methylase
MDYNIFYETSGHSYEEYERSHKPRLDFLVEDLKLNELYDKKIADVGCGLGFIHNRLKPEIQKNYIGFDGANMEGAPFLYHAVDLDNFHFRSTKEDYFDVVMCFETIEHLTNPYNCLLEIKRMLKPDGIVYLSIPHQNTTHNTIYPSLLYPLENFIVFLRQMAFEVKDIRYHDKSFSQNVLTLVNKDWSHSKMVYYKREDKFRNIPPHESVNL